MLTPVVSATTENAQAAVSTESLEIWNCSNCRRRKVRCDRHQPCTQCCRQKLQCVFPTSGRLPRRSRHAKTQPVSHKRVELLSRLRRLEAMVGDLGSQVEHVDMGNQNESDIINFNSKSHNAASFTAQHLIASNQSTPGTRSSTDSGVESDVNAAETYSQATLGASEDYIMENSDGELVVGDRFWTVFCKEVEHIFEAVHGPSVLGFEENGHEAMSGKGSHMGYLAFLLRSTSGSAPQNVPHPSPSQMLFLWQIYLDNVDPFTKVVHLSAVSKLVRELRGGYQALTPNLEALVLAIAFAAVMSLEDQEVRLNFDIDKTQLVARCRLGTELALGKIDIIANPDMIALQALTIYLTTLQHTGGGKAAWVMNGLLIRTAISLDLHRDDGSRSNSSALDTELRRRLWWQICLNDSRPEGQRASAFGMSETMFNTHLPTNIHDETLDDSTTEPVGLAGITDMSIFLLRCDIWRFSQQLRHKVDIHQVFAYFQSWRTSIEERYLQHFDTRQPLHCFVTATTSLFMAKVELILHSKLHLAPRSRSSTPRRSYDEIVFTLSLTILEDAYALQYEAGWVGWRWQLRSSQPPWHTLRVLLGRLSACSSDFDRNRAWSIIKRFLEEASKHYDQDPQYRQLLHLVSVTALQPEISAEAASSSSSYDILHEPVSALNNVSPKFGDSLRSIEHISQPEGIIQDFNGSMLTDADNAFDFNSAIDDDLWFWESINLDSVSGDGWNV